MNNNLKQFHQIDMFKARIPSEEIAKAKAGFGKVPPSLAEYAMEKAEVEPTGTSRAAEYVIAKAAAKAEQEILDRNKTKVKRTRGGGTGREAYRAPVPSYLDRIKSFLRNQWWDVSLSTGQWYLVKLKSGKLTNYVWDDGKFSTETRYLRDHANIEKIIQKMNPIYSAENYVGIIGFEEA